MAAGEGSGRAWPAFVSKRSHGRGKAATPLSLGSGSFLLCSCGRVAMLAELSPGVL